MSVPIELAVGLPVIAVAAVTLWFQYIYKMIDIKTKDLDAGQQDRDNFVQKTLTEIQSRIKKVEDSLSAKNGATLRVMSSELKDELDNVIDMADDLETIQNAKATILASLRILAVRVGLLIIGVTIGVAILVVALYELTNQTQTLEAISTAVLEAVFFLGAIAITKPRRNYLKIAKLLQEKNLEKIA